MNYRETRELLTISHAFGDIDDDEFITLYEAYSSKNLDFPYKSYPRFELEDLDEAECVAEFRFQKKDIPILSQALRVPEVFRCRQGTVCSGLEGLCILLRRMAYPCRFSDLVPRFGRPVPELSIICNQVTDFIFDTHGQKINQWNDFLLNPATLEIYAAAIKAKGAALDNCFGFIDGTVRPICRPDQHQRQVYNGHKRVHALKFQSVTLPNGIIANLYGPVGKMWFMCILYFKIMIVYVVYNVAWLFAVQAVSRCYYSGKL